MSITSALTEVTLLQREDLERLVTEDGGEHVSIYLPTRRAVFETRQDSIRLKNLLRQAERRLAERRLGRPQVDELLAPARELVGDDRFWEHQAEGLAIFLRHRERHVYRVPLPVTELVVVDNRFHVKPLLPLLGNDGRFWVLALSQLDVRLFEASATAMREVDQLDVPHSLRDVVGYDFEENSLQLHTASAHGAGGRRVAVFHGRGEGIDDKKEEIATFLRAVDHGLRSLLRGQEAPLVIAAVAFEADMFRRLSGYPHVLERGIEGNPELTGAGELHAAAWKLIEPLFAERRQQAADRYRQLAGTGMASVRLEEIVPAAVDGRVAALFVATDAPCWGTYDIDERRVRLHSEWRPGDRDLVELAAARGLVQGAEVYAAAREEMPCEGAAAALYRY